ncbi:MAG: dimethyladenosine transferase, rRNA (adenine1518-N6/adenine1519-N6)-dimethyltransferase [Candidatus Parcubacteria bacterium]|jgi:16S rRNA (adenine1518-N6/adenine1519-N6)-dimethyltransferase
MKFEHKKSLGQNFLNSAYAPKKMCDAANLEKGNIVLEIGPGTGALTKEILARGARVIALEADSRAIKSLENTFATEIAAGQLTLHHHDARTIEPGYFGLKNQQYKVVSNIPYYLSGLLFRTLLETDIQPNTLVFLVQKEVATRIARDKKESLLSLSVKVYGDPTYICTVGRGHFTPSPKVDSAVIAIRNISKQRLNGIKEKRFFTLLHLGFGQKRKQLVANLSSVAPREVILEALQSLSLSPTVRAEDIPADAWIALIKLLPQTR